MTRVRGGGPCIRSSSVPPTSPAALKAAPRRWSRRSWSTAQKEAALVALTEAQVAAGRVHGPGACRPGRRGRSPRSARCCCMARGRDTYDAARGATRPGVGPGAGGAPGGRRRAVVGARCGPSRRAWSRRRSTRCRSYVDRRDAVSGRSRRCSSSPREHDARDLKQIGKRILDVVAPEVGECHEADRAGGRRRPGPLRAWSWPWPTTARAGATAASSVPSHVGDDARGGTCWRWPTPRATPRPSSGTTPGEWKPLRRRLGEAFVEYVERYPVERDAADGGGERHRGGDDDAGAAPGRPAPRRCWTTAPRMSAGQARRLACEAGIIPVVGSPPGPQPLDLGRTVAALHERRSGSPSGLRDGGCTATGCETACFRVATPTTTSPWSRRGPDRPRQLGATALPAPSPPGPRLRATR